MPAALQLSILTNFSDPPPLYQTLITACKGVKQIDRSHLFLAKKRPLVLRPEVYHWWRRRDSYSSPFRKGWTMPSSHYRDAGRIIRKLRILVPAHVSLHQQVYESLQGRPGVGLLPTPRRYHIPSVLFSDADRFHRCEPRFSTYPYG